jgi:predicted NUDIX family NTP pyrophosphohydrolase
MSRRSEVSAGLVAFRRRKGLEVLLGHPGGPYWASRDDGSWSIPKGATTEPASDLLETARREFSEETGFVAKGPFIPLAPVKQRSGKTVHAFAFEADFDLSGFASNIFELEWPPRSGQMQKFPEIDRVAYFPYAAALNKIIDYQRPLLLDFADALLDDRSVIEERSAR